MFLLSIDYYLFVFVASLGVLQASFSLSNLKGLLIFKQPLMARSFGFALSIAAFVWFFSSDTRNLNDNQGGLDANSQAILFFLGVLTAIAVIIIVSSLLNYHMNRISVPSQGLDALRYTNYVKAINHSVRYRQKEIPYITKTRKIPSNRVKSVSLGLVLIGLLLIGVIFLWISDWTGSFLILDHFINTSLIKTITQADKTTFIWINDGVGHFHAIDRIMEWIVSDYLVPVTFALTLTSIWFVQTDGAIRMKNQINIFVALSAMGLSSWIVAINNALYFRPRPFINSEVSLLFYKPTDSSFPANTTAVTFAIATAIWMIDKRIGMATYLMAGLYGFSRIYSGVHYPLDILGGALVGIIVTLLTLKLKDLLEPLPTFLIKLGRIICLA